MKVILQITAGGIAFMLWFLVCLSYMYGTLYLSPSRHAAFHVLAVDYDGGVYPSEEDVYRAVWRGDYRASIVATDGASTRLSAALQGGQAASTYSSSNALHYVWNQQYYTTFANAIVQGHMTQLIAATRLAYNKINGTQASHAVNTTDSAAVQAFLNPIQAGATNIHATTFGTSILMNTVSMAMPIMQQFFFLLVLNGVLGMHNLYKKMTVMSNLRFRRIAGSIFTFGAALCQAGYYWAFREKWDVNGNQFVLTWMIIWLLMHIHLLVLDSISTVAPLPVMPFVVLLWVLLNMASALSPLELQAGFFHWGIALPSHEAYSVMVAIWTGGAHNRLYRALPILFACGHGDGKDEEPGPSLRNFLSKLNTMSRTPTRLKRQRTVNEAALERREVYGPGIPPLA
ncbi:hypothetical protein EK21DRAFT_99679 [Setomelanomma holmii]|uniref:DUF3533 domain-containing protein n=1 Tax=Setomelanomma holmii TaxID=210430 RepID=A0A9P4HC42_9PLEO|nr:hypothetical protein EK21DRAFT_99679 [Setomelanomma holmii]